MLSARQVWFGYRRGEPVVCGLDLSIEAGQIVGLTGPSGSGKSTVARLLSGHLQPFSGRIEVQPRRYPVSSRANPVQLVSQQPERAMNPRWRVRDVLAEAEPSEPEQDRLVGTLVDRSWRDRFPHEISGGELQRVNLARALLARPTVIIADEISASVDPITQATLWRRVAAFAEQGGAVLAISHDLPLLDAISDRIVRLEELRSLPTD